MAVLGRPDEFVPLGPVFLAVYAPSQRRGSTEVGSSKPIVGEIQWAMHSPSPTMTSLDQVLM